MATSQGRSPRPVRSLSSGPVLVVALLCLAGVTPPTAHADSVDDQFLNAVKAHGINFSASQNALLAAHQVCDELDSGRQKSDVVNDVMNSSSLDGYHAGYFVGASIAAFCPRHHSSA
jgi:hypothetical protein